MILCARDAQRPVGQTSPSAAVVRTIAGEVGPGGPTHGVDYIRGNPSKARLQPGSFIVGCGVFEIGKSGSLASGGGADGPVCPE